MIKAKVIKDSILNNVRITTLQLVYPRFILPEFNTHRVFSRSSSSSRAIPISKVIDSILSKPAMPIHWGKNQAGMQAKDEIEEDYKAEKLWIEAAQNACDIASEMRTLNLHKQVVNRILEPFVHISTVVTSTEWDNFFALRLHPDAQPEIQELARVMKLAMDSSEPVKTNCHLPYITDQDIHYEQELILGKYEIDNLLAKVSAARCARVSYLKHDGSEPSIEDDLELFERLSSMVPMHASPMEHQAIRQDDDKFYKNFKGWKQFRQYLEENSYE